MTDKRKHHICTFAEDDQVVEIVQKHLGTNDYSAAVRFIIRRFAEISDPDHKILHKKSVSTSSKRRVAKRSGSVDGIPGVTRGVKAA